jgi:hypothetical protein
VFRSGLAEHAKAARAFAPLSATLGQSNLYSIAYLPCSPVRARSDAANTPRSSESAADCCSRSHPDACAEEEESILGMTVACCELDTSGLSSPARRAKERAGQSVTRRGKKRNGDPKGRHLDAVP